MVRTKSQASIAFSYFPGASDNGSSSDREIQIEMGKKASSSETLFEL